MPFDAATPRPLRSLRSPAPPAQPSAASLSLLAAWRSGGPLLSFQRAVIRAALNRADRAGERLNPAHIEAALASGAFAQEMYS